MALGAGTASDPRYRYFPAIGAPENEILEYRDRLINPWSMFRNSFMGQAGLGIAYFLGHQWAELDPTVAFEGFRGAFIRDMMDEETGTAVRPVDNLIDPGVEAEVIALVKRGYIPKVVATENDPKIKAAAQVSHDRLNYTLEEMKWPEKRHRHALYFALTGTGLLYTAAEKSYMTLKTIGAPSAVGCPSCGAKLYSPDVPLEVLDRGVEDGAGGYVPAKNLEYATAVAPDETQIDIQEARLPYCPVCPTPTPLEPVDIDPDAAATDFDVFGRPLGVDVPRDIPIMEIDLPFEFYPQNAGAKVTPDTLRRWGRRKVRELEWVEERYPHLVHLLDPEPVTNLLYGDPIFGGANTFDGWNPGFDAGILDHHINVDEIVQEPSFRYPEGRYAVCSKDLVLEEGPLMESIEVEGADGGTETVMVPRVRQSSARFKLRPDVFWGTSIVQHEIPKQNRLNGLDAQVISFRLQAGSPNLMMPHDMWPQEGAAFDDGWGSGKLLFTQPSLSQPGFTKPEVIGGMAFPADGWIPERNAILASNQKSMGVSPATQGQAPGKGIGTTSGLQLLVEQDDKSRSLREDELVGSVQWSWRHILDIEWVLGHNDEGIYKTSGPNDTTKIEQYKGSMLRGQTQVKIERSAFIGRSVIQREAAREAIADGVVTIDSPVTKRKMREMYGLDSDLNEDQSNQVDHAERVWVDFTDKKVVAIQDDVDDPIIHYNVLVTHLRTDEGERLAKAAGWDQIESVIAGWQDELRILTELEAESFAFYRGRPVGQEAEDAYTAATLAYDTKMKTYQQQVQTAAAISNMPPVIDITGAPKPPPVLPPAEPPSKPPVPVQAPQLLQERVFEIWRTMAEKTGQAALLAPAPTPEQGVIPPTDPSVYVRLRALTAAYRITMGQNMGPAAAAMPTPGSGATMLPGDKGAPPMPAPTAPMPEGGKH